MIKNVSTVRTVVLKKLRWPLILALLVGIFAAVRDFLPGEIAKHVAFDYGIKLTYILLIIWTADRTLASAIRSNSIPYFLTKSSQSLMLLVLRTIFLSLGLLVILDTFGISITPLLASLGIGSLAVALALQDTLSHFFSGIYLLVDQPIRVGDYVRLDNGVEGYVEKIGWRSTHIRPFNNNLVIIPNAKVSSAIITNMELPGQQTTVTVRVGVDYSSDLKKVEAVCLAVAKEVIQSTPGGFKTGEPLLRFIAFAESSIDLDLILPIERFVDTGIVRNAFIQALHSRFAKEGIGIPFPQRVVHTAPSA